MQGTNKSGAEELKNSLNFVHCTIKTCPVLQGICEAVKLSVCRTITT